MDPALKAYLDKLTETLTKASDDTRADIKGIKAQIDTNTAQVEELTTWKPDLEARLSKLQETVAVMQGAPPPSAAAPIGGSSAADRLDPAARTTIHGPDGHGEDSHIRSELPGGNSSPAATPAKGMVNFQTPMSQCLTSSSAGSATMSAQFITSFGHTPPSLNFPQFSGQNPKIWKTMCEQYFSMFQIHETYFVPMATLHFSGATAIWLQSVQSKIGPLDWDAFCELLCTRFGRDRHQFLIRQFYSLKQTSSVAEYIEQFETLMNHLISYSVATHPLYFLTRFVEGLRSDIRAVVLVQRPGDLDTACALAILQQEVIEGQRYKTRGEHPEFSPYPARTRPPVPVPLPAPPVRAANPAPVADDRRGTESARASGEAAKVTALSCRRRGSSTHR